MKKKGIVAASISFLIACSVEIYRETHYFKQKKVSFRSNKLPGGSDFTILQMTDLHNNIFGTDNEQLINTVEAANADVIVLTGDMIDKRTKTFEHVFSFIERLTANNRHVLFVSGNHEWENGRSVEFFKGLRDRNVTILDNQNIQMKVGDVTLNIVGVSDASTEHEDVHKAFMNVNREHYTILLSHCPDIIDIYSEIPADLILSGHTHGGQVRFPFIGALIAPGQGFFPKRAKGTYRLPSHRHLYIDSGLGTTRLPVRFLNQSQLSLIKITGDK